jgi:hypothetical protein
MFDLTGTVYLVCVIFVCYASIYMFDLLPQKSKRIVRIIFVFSFLCKQNFSLDIITNYEGGPQNDCA